MVQVKIFDSLMCGFEGTRILTAAGVLRFFLLELTQNYVKKILRNVKQPVILLRR